MIYIIKIKFYSKLQYYLFNELKLNNCFIQIYINYNNIIILNNVIFIFHLKIKFPL